MLPRGRWPIVTVAPCISAACQVVRLRIQLLLARFPALPDDRVDGASTASVQMVVGAADKTKKCLSWGSPVLHWQLIWRDEVQ